MSPDLKRVTRNVQPQRFDYVVYTDGACKGNPGPGGWGAAAFEGELSKERQVFGHCGGTLSTTNNRMELSAVIEALTTLSTDAYQTESAETEMKVAPRLLIVVDSEYVLKGVTEWSEGWVKRNWIKADKKPVVNADLWKRLLALLTKFDSLTWCWVKGHSKDFGNEIADQLANEGVRMARERQAEPA